MRVDQAVLWTNESGPGCKGLYSLLVITETPIIQIIFRPALTDGRDEGLVLVIFITRPRAEGGKLSKYFQIEERFLKLQHFPDYKANVNARPDSVDTDTMMGLIVSPNYSVQMSNNKQVKTAVI